MIQHLTIQALNTFVFVDIAFGEDGFHRTILRAFLAGVAAFLVALQPVKQAQFGGNGERRAHRAEIAAIEALDKEAY